VRDAVRDHLKVDPALVRSRDGAKLRHPGSAACGHPTRLPPGVVLGADLIRLQCYKGLDENKALYEWDYQKQLLRIQLLREEGAVPDEGHLFSEEYLLERPLLKAIRAPRRPVLLIDEVGKCDPEFEAFLFEVLSDFTVSLP
jgi:MoxR-like ATPase